MPAHAWLEVQCTFQRLKNENRFNGPTICGRMDYPVELIHINKPFIEKYSMVDIPYIKAGDHIFVAVAKVDNCPLITTDAKMTDVCKRCGVSVFTPAQFMKSEYQMKSEINSIIEKGRKIEQTIGEMVIKHDYPQGDKHRILVGYYSVLAEHHVSIHLLIQNQLYGSGFALVRAFYEPLYRAHWVNKCASDKEINEIIRGKDVFPNMKTMVEEIDRVYGTGNFWQTVRNNSWAAMNDYVHSGMRQIGRRFIEDEVVPDYSLGEIKEVLNGINVALLLMALFFFKVYKKTNDIEVIEKMIREYTNRTNREKKS